MLNPGLDPGFTKAWLLGGSIQINKEDRTVK